LGRPTVVAGSAAGVFGCSVTGWVASAEARLRPLDGPAFAAVEARAIAAIKTSLRIEIPFVG
jgi:hypothetical protein